MVIWRCEVSKLRHTLSRQNFQEVRNSTRTCAHRSKLSKTSTTKFFFFFFFWGGKTSQKHSTVGGVIQWDTGVLQAAPWMRLSVRGPQKSKRRVRLCAFSRGKISLCRGKAKSFDVIFLREGHVFPDSKILVWDEWCKINIHWKTSSTG